MSCHRLRQSQGRIEFYTQCASEYNSKKAFNAVTRATKPLCQLALYLRRFNELSRQYWTTHLFRLEEVLSNFSPASDPTPRVMSSSSLWTPDYLVCHSSLTLALNGAGMQYHLLSVVGMILSMTRTKRENIYLAIDRKSTRLNSSHKTVSRMPSSA